MKTTLTYSALVELEPRLKEAEALARQHAGEDSDRLWFHVIKPAFKTLVGFASRHPHAAVRSGEAYRVAYAHLLGIYDNRGDAGEG
ncbi:hypothetical protein [Fundidesulfovibrio agrisoli]|uniref:hypothetical protein n=1 Tax=Fundidesulfovibrio agrisoli TaxID=2922717 RepID=UPI001FAC6883|nr:hypothetical protein [Fundidesulfovibrio agrisoli]